MKNYKKFICLVISVIILFSMNLNTFASSDSKQINEKKALVVYATNSEKHKTTAEKSLYASDPSIGDRLIAEMVSFGYSRNQIRETADDYGVYVLDYDGMQANTVIMASDNSNVTMSTPIIAYNSSTNRWSVTGGGYWKNDNWEYDLPWIFFGNIINVGGHESFGVGYTNTSGMYNTYIISSYAYISDGKGHQVSTTNRSDGNGMLGFGFRLQDYYWQDSIMPSLINGYVGKHFAGQCIYSSNFTYYNGIATSYYTHTYSNAQISSVTFGVEGKTAGVSVTVTNQESSWPAYSNDRIF